VLYVVVFFCFVKEFGHKHSSLRVTINFYLKTVCSTILHSLSHKNNGKNNKKKKLKKSNHDESFIAHLMPYLLQGLKSKCLDYKRATYLILSHLSNIFTFQTNVKDEILNVLSKVRIQVESNTMLWCVVLLITIVFIDIYIFYLGLCRWFNKRKSSHRIGISQ
jgi:hypothetical protein